MAIAADTKRDDRALQNRPMTERWEMVLTVGPDDGDLRGSDDKVLQAAADYLHRLGGGILQILPGEYTMRNALRLHPDLTVRGSGDETVLKKTPSTITNVTRDSDWYESRVEVADATGFTAGCGVVLRSSGKSGVGASTVVRDTVTKVDGNVISLSKRSYKNLWIEQEATLATLYPILTADEGVTDVVIEDLVLDGNREVNEELNGNHVGGVFLQNCHRFTFRNVESRNYSGDGFSFQVCDDIHFQGCRSIDNGILGFHPGSGSQRPVFQNCISTGNAQGLFFCWGVSDGLAENCTLSDNRMFGASVGHRDTDNRILNCTIERNHEVGILFRIEGPAFRCGHRTVIESCTIVDNGYKADGVGVDIRGEVFDVAIRKNRIGDSGKKLQKVGIRVGSEAGGTVLEANEFSNLERDVEGAEQSS